jgi:hypothetical protein
MSALHIQMMKAAEREYKYAMERKLKKFMADFNTAAPGNKRRSIATNMVRSLRDEGALFVHSHDRFRNTVLAKCNEWMREEVMRVSRRSPLFMECKKLIDDCKQLDAEQVTDVWDLQSISEAVKAVQTDRVGTNSYIEYDKWFERKLHKCIDRKITSLDAMLMLRLIERHGGFYMHRHAAFRNAVIRRCRTWIEMTEHVLLVKSCHTIIEMHEP